MFRRLLGIGARELYELPLWERQALVDGLNKELGHGPSSGRVVAVPDKEIPPAWFDDLPMN